MSNKTYKLIIFDMDGTLADRDTGELLEGVAEWFDVYRHDTGGVKLALATNQGGVGLRYWMEKDGFGNPEKYPVEGEVLNSITRLIARLGISPIQMSIHVAFRYVSAKGNVSPLPSMNETDFSHKYWSAHSRKPEPGMLLDAMSHYHIEPKDTLMVGDRPEDEEAAKNAGVDFQWAWDFFGRDKPE